MARVPYLSGKRVAVMGLGKSGTSAARALEASGASVTAWDDQPAARAAAEAAGIAVGPLDDLAGIALVVWSPGIPHTYPKPHPVAQAGRALGIPLVCDIELLAAANPDATFIGITGTNGKSTTTTLAAHLLTAAGRDVAVGGNLGTPALDLPMAKEIYVLELSSYQLELLDRIRFDVGLLLNITPDHIARHGSMDGYVAAKASLFSRLKAGGTAVVGVDDAHCRAIHARLRQISSLTLVGISTGQALSDGISVTDGRLIDGPTGAVIADVGGLPHLPGRHNWQNAAAAAAAARAVGLSPAAIAAGLASYPGLAHRQEFVATIDGVAYVNDSKATNADATEKALVCYDNIYWILGGQPKEGGIASLAPLFGRVRQAFLIGDAAPAFAKTLGDQVRHQFCGTLDVALAAAREAALADHLPGAVVLLSPACASWDQFKSFEHRGDVFRDLVNALPGVRGAA